MIDHMHLHMGCVNHHSYTNRNRRKGQIAEVRSHTFLKHPKAPPTSLASVVTILTASPLSTRSMTAHTQDTSLPNYLCRLSKARL